ncbi:MAG: PEP-utilizing enzyme, partial [Pseudomonadota bacterium]
MSEAVESRILLTRLRDALKEAGEGQERLDRITHIVSDGLAAEVCSIYLAVGEELELCATTGLNPQAVHQTRMRTNQGLVGRIAQSASPFATANAQTARGFRYFPETGEEVYASFLGVPIQRLGDVLGVLVVQNREERVYDEDTVYALEVVAMVIAEMAELGAFNGTAPTDPPMPHKAAWMAGGVVGQEGLAKGVALLHDPEILIANPVADEPVAERARLQVALSQLRKEVDRMLSGDDIAALGEHRDVLNAWRMFAHDKGWVRRMEASIDSGLAAEVAVEKEQSATRSRMARVPDAYLRDRLHDLDDLSNRLLRLLTGAQAPDARDIPDRAVLIARNIGPGELLDYGRKLAGVVLEEGSVGSHAAIVARALAIPLLIQVKSLTREARDGDTVLVDGEEGVVHLRPEADMLAAFRAKTDLLSAAREAYTALRDKPAVTRDGTELTLLMNAGLMADLPSLHP